MYPYYLQIGLSVALLGLYLLLGYIFRKLIARYGAKKNLHENRISQAKRFSSSVLGLMLLLFIGIIWEITLHGLSLYFVSFFTVAGIALFAQWSILSNITSSIILFFYFPIKIGSRVKILYGEDTIEGEVRRITLFSIIINAENGQKISYPNNLAISRPIIELP